MKRTSSAVFEQESVRIYLLFLAMVGVVALLVTNLARLQLRNRDRFVQDLNRYSLRRVAVPGIRGRIFDRNGACLAGNRPSYGIAVYLEELRQYGRFVRGRTLQEQVSALLGRLSEALQTNVVLSASDIASHLKQRSAMPLVAWRDVDDRVRARWAEHATQFPGVDLYLETVRTYPFGRTGAHLMGYVGRAQPHLGAGDERYHFYLPDMDGRQGLERKFDLDLRGKAGEQWIRIDVRGFKVSRRMPDDDQIEQPAVPEKGSDIKLTIDVRIQQWAEQALGTNHGAVVVMDPRQGDVLALASAPGFDPNDLSGRLSIEAWDALQADADAPMLNRAVSGGYAPGSLFKPVVAAAALQQGFNPQTVFDCPGYYALGNTQLKCWIYRQGSHGGLALRKAIEQSCNTYFCNLCVRASYEAVYDMALAVGLGRPTGIALDSEARGLVPSPSSVRTRGDVANLSIGQGALQVTPLQMACLASTLAAGGRCRRPRLVLAMRGAGDVTFRENPPFPEVNLGWSPTTVSVIRSGMTDVVMAPTGTGKRARVEDLTMAGKTGTAEFRRPGGDVKWGWMMVYAPVENPRYAVAMVVEHADSGGRTVAPRVRRLVSAIYGRPVTDDERVE